MANNTRSPISVTAPASGASETLFVNAMRLNSRHWLAVAVLVTVIAVTTPWLWKKLERFETPPDYRIPYTLSKDYWLYERRMQRIGPTQIAVLGDSVIWGEYVRADGTLSHFLNEQTGVPGRFVNGGVNGLFPLAFEGLIRHYGSSLRDGKVLLHCNVLWMSSPKADLNTKKEERFNHADLVPQFSPGIPCYKAELHHRLAAIVTRNFTFAQWANHLQVAYFDQKNILAWTLEEDTATPPRYPNALKNPLAEIAMVVPGEPAVDPERGPASPRHKPWSSTGQGATRFEWVELNQSLQWGAFQRVLKLLHSRNDEVLVVVGPFNEHIMTEENRAAFRRLRDGIADWLGKNRVPYIVPAVLPSALYADGSHPLTEGYQMLAAQLIGDSTFRKWMEVEAK
jgi:hypothetical protein